MVPVLDCLLFGNCPLIPVLDFLLLGNCPLVPVLDFLLFGNCPLVPVLDFLLFGNCSLVPVLDYLVTVVWKLFLVTCIRLFYECCLEFNYCTVWLLIVWNLSVGTCIQLLIVWKLSVGTCIRLLSDCCLETVRKSGFPSRENATCNINNFNLNMYLRIYVLN